MPDRCRWISVDDELPPAHPDEHCFLEVIIYIPKLDKGTINENGVFFGRYNHKGNFWRMAGSPSEWNITHWQPKPKPPSNIGGNHGNT